MHCVALQEGIAHVKLSQQHLFQRKNNYDTFQRSRSSHPKVQQVGLASQILNREKRLAINSLSIKLSDAFEESDLQRQNASLVENSFLLEEHVQGRTLVNRIRDVLSAFIQRARICSLISSLMSSHDEMFKCKSGLGLLAAVVICPESFGSGIAELLNNQAFMSAYFAWMFAQLLKVPTHYFATGKWRLKAMVDAGGMPSSHSSLCMGLTTSIALQHGLSSSLFPVCLGFSLIVMYDAAGVRRHAGKQAEAINKLMAEMYKGILNRENGPLLKEVLGHTPIQVAAGAILGIFTGIVYGIIIS